MSCLACLSDQSCGWCSSVSRCLLRNSADTCPEEDWDGKGEGWRHLLLAPQHCPLCEEYRDCSACTQVLYMKENKVFFNARILLNDSCKVYVFTQDPYCEWQINSSKKGDYQCSRRGRLDGSIRDPKGCPRVCNQ